MSRLQRRPETSPGSSAFIRSNRMTHCSVSETNPRLDARDAVFAAVALNRGIDVILATDRAFDEVDGLKRIDPADERALATLTG